MHFGLPSARRLSDIDSFVTVAEARRQGARKGHLKQDRGEPAMAGAESVRSVALVGANGSGKTTLLESLLFVSGAIGRKGKVGEGNMVGDA